MKKLPGVTFCFLLCLLFWACTDDNEIGKPIPPNPCYIPPEENSEIIPDINYDEFDEYFRFQGYLNYSGKHGIPEYEKQAAIDILPAWKITKGENIKVVVFDDNIQKNHEEFANVLTWNIIDDSENCEPKDRKHHSHGTATLGLIAAQKNGVGIMGVASECEFMFIGDWTISDDKDVIKAFEHAKNWGAKVISCSWGTYNAPSTLENMLKSFYEDGITIVFAAGNNKMNLDNNSLKDESELEWVIGVSASNEKGVIANFSNYGSNIDIMAPGSRILTLDLMGSEGSNKGSPFANNNYTFLDGTSFSAPIVAGVAALIYSASTNPNITPAEVRQIIIDTARKNLPTNGTGFNKDCFSLYHAYGLIDAGRAVRRAAGLDDTTTQTTTAIISNY